MRSLARNGEVESGPTRDQPACTRKSRQPSADAAEALSLAAYCAGRQTLPVFVLVWSATQAEARKPPAGLSVANSHRGRLQMPLQKAVALADLWPPSGAGPAWVSSASLSKTLIVTLADEPVRLAIEHSTSAPPPAVTGAEPSVAAAAGGTAGAAATTAASKARTELRSRDMAVLRAKGRPGPEWQHRSISASWAGSAGSKYPRSRVRLCQPGPWPAWDPATGRA